MFFGHQKQWWRKVFLPNGNLKPQFFFKQKKKKNTIFLYSYHLVTNLIESYLNKFTNFYRKRKSKQEKIFFFHKYRIKKTQVTFL